MRYVQVEGFKGMGKGGVQRERERESLGVVKGHMTHHEKACQPELAFTYTSLALSPSLSHTDANHERKREQREVVRRIL